MKKLFVLIIVVLLTCNYSMAAEKRPLRDVDTDAFTNDTQAMARGAGDDHLALAWWIPKEYWESILSRDMTTSRADKKAMLDALSGTSLLAVVQADISHLGAFKFYAKEEIEGQMSISFSDAAGNRHRLAPLQKVSSDLEIVLGVFKPILGAAMGNLGNNFHFYVLSDQSNSMPRLLDPYLEGSLTVQLSRKDGVIMPARIEMPLNSLFVPRKCPNGKDAHISWRYCPWSGKQLEE